MSPDFDFRLRNVHMRGQGLRGILALAMLLVAVTVMVLFVGESVRPALLYVLGVLR